MVHCIEPSSQTLESWTYLAPSSSASPTSHRLHWPDRLLVSILPLPFTCLTAPFCCSLYSSLNGWKSVFAVRNLKWHVISHVSSHGGRQAHSQGEELDSCRASQSGVPAWGWAALWQTRGDRDVCLAHQRSPVVASLSAHMPNSSFKTYIWGETLYAVLFTSPYQQRHSPSQTALEVLRQGLKQ